ncbi:MAG: T9SS type A sorting domain-containing protein [Bacteroidia bacterium]
MNKLIIALLIGISTCSQAQTDTLNSFFNESDSGLIESPNGGYLSGTNGYRDMEKLQAFYPANSYSVLGFIYGIGAVANPSGNAESSVTFRIRTLDTTSTSAAPFVAGPAQGLDSVIVPLSEIVNSPNSSGFVAFNQPVLVTQPYLVGFSLEYIDQESGMFTDTFAVISTAADSALLAGLSWEKWDGVYKRIVDSWGVNVDFAVFPVIDTTLNSATSVSIETLTFYPNPASSEINLTGLDKNALYTLEITDISGRTALRQKCITIGSSYSVNTSGLAAGAYSVILRSREKYNMDF